MKTLVVGDLHLKQPFVLPAIDALLAFDGEIGRVVFLGDACDDWGASEADELGAMRRYARWVAEHRGEGLAIDVLLGNHDFCYIRGKRGPGSVMTIMRELRGILEDDLQVRVACAVGPFVCSHAGLTNTWARRHMGEALPPEALAFAAEALAARLNEMLADSANWEAFDSCPPSRGGWSLPGPLWADLHDLLDDPLDGVPQIVGHTPVACVDGYVARGGSPGCKTLWACDTMSVTSLGMPIGDGSMLLVGETGLAEPVPFPGGRDFQEACSEYWLQRRQMP